MYPQSRHHNETGSDQLHGGVHGWMDTVVRWCTTACFVTWSQKHIQLLTPATVVTSSPAGLRMLDRTALVSRSPTGGRTAPLRLSCKVHLMNATCMQHLSSSSNAFLNPVSKPLCLQPLIPIHFRTTQF